MCHRRHWLVSDGLKSVSCMFSVVFSLQSRCMGCCVAFSNPKCFILVTMYGTTHAHSPPPPLAHARPCLSTGWALNRRFEEILGPLFLWSRMEDWVSVECLYRERGAH